MAKRQGSGTSSGGRAKRPPAKKSGPAKAARPAGPKAKGGAKRPKAAAAPRPAAAARAAPPPRPAAPVQMQTAAPPRRHGLEWLWAVAGALMVGALGALAWSLWPPRTVEFIEAQGKLPVLEERVAALADRIEALEERRIEALETTAERFEALEGRVAELPEAEAVNQAEATAALVAETAAGLKSRVAELETSMGRMEARLAEVRASTEAPVPVPEAEAAKLVAERNAAKLVELRGRVEALESAPREAAAVGAGRQALVVAVGQLREALRTSEPFGRELEVVESLAEGDARVAAAVAEISAFAEGGVATGEELRARFPSVANAVVQASRTPEEGDWMDEALSRAASVVTVRPTGADVAGDEPKAVVARGEARLEAGDLKGAVAELNALAGPPRAAAQTWLDDARARLTAERALKDLHAHVVGQIAQGDGPSE